MLIHNGIVRGASKSGKPVQGVNISFSEEKLKSVIPIFKHKKGIVEVKVWLDPGNLNVGDNIMLLLVAGRFKNEVLPVCKDLLSFVKNKIVTEEEVL
jgi:molybdopterin synthase catalytic subunit